MRQGPQQVGRRLAGGWQGAGRGSFSALCERGIQGGCVGIPSGTKLKCPLSQKMFFAAVKRAEEQDWVGPGGIHAGWVLGLPLCWFVRMRVPLLLAGTA